MTELPGPGIPERVPNRESRTQESGGKVRPYEEFWELVVVRREGCQECYTAYDHEALRQAFVSEEAARDRAEEDNKGRLGEAHTPIRWRGDHHGGVRSIESPDGQVDYYVFPRTVFQRVVRA
jgi:hypothetical protein